ncbi:SRPBCC family protein [Agromyces sp. G08B096]|uniref:SRPBCC family protein n=1 Tax=Agromyces sp. G08B096 TaxID=3156399 RepID=A0AAU7W567_9MICO
MDIRAQLDAADRGIADGERDGEAVRVQTVARIYPAPIDDVWSALTSAERIPRWFLPVSGDLRLGGRYQLEGNAGGTIEACDAPNSFAATWEYGGGVTWITVRLSALDDERTRVELEHVARVADVPDEIWEQYGPSGTGIGWDQAMLGLDLHLTTGEVTPENASEWVMSDEGLAFMRGSADRWAAAQAANGTDAAVANAAADATYAMYTGQAPGPMG